MAESLFISYALAVVLGVGDILVGGDNLGGGFIWGGVVNFAGGNI